MSYFKLASLRLPILLGLALVPLGPLAMAQQALPHDPRDERAYEASAHRKPTADAPLLLSTVHYITRADTLSPFDSSWIVYSPGGTRVSELYTFRWSSGQWIPYDRYTYRYNSNNLNDQTLYDTWNATNADYVPLVRYTYSHDAAGERSGLFYEIWHRISARYRNGLMEYYTVDANGLRISAMQQVWNIAGSSWDNNTNETYAHNPQGKVQNYVYHFWDASAATWAPKRQLTTSFDASGLIPVLEEENTWISASAAWSPKLRFVNSVSGSRIRSRVKEYYDLNAGSWSPASRETLTYNANGDLDESLMADWNAAARRFDDSYRSSYMYNSWYQPKRIDKLIPDLGKWIVASGAEQTRYYYVGDTVKPSLGMPAAGAVTETLAVRPVPASEVLTVDLQSRGAEPLSLTVFDMSGRAVIHEKLAAPAARTFSIDVRSLPAGSYVVNVQTAAGSQPARQFTIKR